ncbi:hypothetical protein [Polaromonas sp. A23]|uniref:hypothetical protein n=1 Tax=Polaromonas sp. A23 TaxID=1944133 RepID=UPI001C2CB4EC|nr:hypothetical protein [Polaromonas sp. A23]
MNLKAWQAVGLLARRKVKAVDLVRACLERIAGREFQVQTLAHQSGFLTLSLPRH